MFNRRLLLKATAALAVSGAVAQPRIVRAASATTLRFIPSIDLAFVDPIYANSAQVSRNHGFMVFDTLRHEHEARSVAADGRGPYRRE